MATNILLADNAPLFRNFVKSAITMTKIDVQFIEIDDGKKLFSAYENNVPEITIIDYNLPNTNTLDFAKKILDIHPVAIIIVFVDSLNHDFVREAKLIGIKEVLYRTIGQFAFGTMIKKMLTKNTTDHSAHEQKSRQNVMTALTMTTLDKSASASQYVKLTNATIQKRIEEMEELKRLGGDFNSTIKNLYDPKIQKVIESNAQKPIEPKDQTKINSTSQNNPNFFIRELSNDQIVIILKDKIAQLKDTKQELEIANNKLTTTVTELEKTKQELVTQKAHLERQVQIQTMNLLKTEKLVAIGELSARIAHDMRNPLSVVKNTLEILRYSLSDRLSENEVQQWKRLDRGIYRMSHQIDDVMDFVRPHPLQKIKTRISTLLADTLEKIAIPPNIEVHVPQNDMGILCDGEKMVAVFVNLILNAVQAIDGNKGIINIIIHDELNDPGSVVIEINDNGPGIPERLKEKIFDPLFTTRQIGTGLGLTSCKRTIEAHGGIIAFESKVGVGTSFFIKLPNKTEWSTINDEHAGVKSEKTLQSLAENP